MTQNTFLSSAEFLLNGTGISILDAARLIKNALDAKSANCSLSDIQFCSQIIEIGRRHIRKIEMSIKEGFAIYVDAKSYLRVESLRDIKYIGNRLLKSHPEFAKCKFSEISLRECERCLSATFSTPSQFNKVRTMLHGLFEFAIRNEWCDKNAIKLIERKRVVEKEIKPFSLSQTILLLKTSQSYQKANCVVPVAILIFAGIRPREVRRLKWCDIDLDENCITIRSICSKTGGVRQVEICPSLKRLLQKSKRESNSYICPSNWTRHWKNIRDNSGFKNAWTQDILRHTYASYHAKCFHDLSRLQLNMGHCNQSLLRSRYINMINISKFDARKFFGCS